MQKNWDISAASAGNVRKTITDMKTLAKKYGGICLSKRYVNGGKKLKWRCKQGHKFSLEPGAVQQVPGKAALTELIHVRHARIDAVGILISDEPYAI
jgi:hypothetical protein